MQTEKVICTRNRSSDICRLTCLFGVDSHMLSMAVAPVVLPNWASTSLSSQPTAPDSWFFPPHTIPDFGGSGFCEEGESRRRVELKCRSQLPVRCRNGINSALFLAAATPHASDISSPDSAINQNLLIFHPASRSILCKSGASSVSLCCLEQVQQHDPHPLSHRVRAAGPAHGTAQSVRAYSLLSSGLRQHVPDSDLVDIQNHRSGDQILLNCGKSACIGSISNDEFQISSRIPLPAFPKSANLALLSTNPFAGLEHEITAIVRSDHSAESGRADYLMIFDCKSQSWRTTGIIGVTSETRCMYSSNDHPRQVLVADDHSFKLCDHRVSERTASLLIFSSHKNAHLFPFEEIMSGTNFSTAHQHLVLSDMHVDLVDERFPGDSLLQVTHCVDRRSGTRLSRIRSQEITFGDRMQDQVLVAVSNDYCICLLCMSRTRGVTVQPQLLDSAVHTFHLNDFPDALSCSGCDSWQSRMPRQRDLRVEGLDLIPSAAGFSVAAVTRNGDLFLQDFEQGNESEGRRGTSFSMQSDASLDLRTTKYLNYSIFNLSARKGSQSVRKGTTNSLKERQPSACKCCHEWHSRTSNSIAEDPPAGRTGLQYGQQPSLFLDRLNKFSPLFEQTACTPEMAEQTVGHEGLPKWNLLTRNLLHAWSLPSQVCSKADFTCRNEFYYGFPLYDTAG